MASTEKGVVLSKAELEFLEDLKKGDISKYKPVYVRTLKHRILKKHKQLTHEALLLNTVIDKLREI